MFWLLVVLVVHIVETSQQITPVIWTEARAGEFPYMVWLASKAFTGFGRITCVGTLISPQWVITDGICATQFDISNHTVIPVNSGVIPDESNAVDVIEKIIHEGFRTAKIGDLYVAQANSLALLKLSEPINLNQGFAPIQLPSEPLSSRTITVIKPTWILLDTIVRYHSTKLYAWSTCMAKYGNSHPYYSNVEGMFCAQERHLDSPTAGPFVKRRSSPLDDVLIGVLANDDTINGNSIYIVTDVGKYREWIRAKTGI